MQTKKIPVRNLRKMLGFMQERQRIYLRKACGEPWPWTEDPILRTYKLCNVYREQDRETVWLREHWREPYAEHKNLWFACCMFRQINWSPTLQAIGFPEMWEPKRVLKVMQDIRARDQKVYTSAYLLKGENGAGVGSKPHSTVYTVLNSVWKDYHKKNSDGPATLTTSLEVAWRYLKQFPNWGPFTAYEVVTDLRHTRYLRDAPDIMTWANTGPGALRGINRLLTGNPREGATMGQGLEYMREILAWLKCERDTSVLPTLELRDVEHCLCEWDKNQRAEESLKTGVRCGLEKYDLAPRRLI